MKNKVLDILIKSNFSNHFLSYVERNFPANYSIKMRQGFYSSNSIKTLLNLEIKDQLIEVLAQLIQLKKDYKKKGIPLSHLYKSIYDLNYRIERYYKNEGVYALTNSDLK